MLRPIRVRSRGSGPCSLICLLLISGGPLDHPRAATRNRVNRRSLVVIFWNSRLH